MKIAVQKENLAAYQHYLRLEECTHRFLSGRDYLRLTLPLLSPALVPESYLEVFETEFRYFEKWQKLYLTPSPELFMKRILAYVAHNCYYLGKSFRNSEPKSSLHSSEFTMLEYYRLGATYMDIATELLEYLKVLNGGKEELIYQGHKVHLGAWEKLSVDEAFVRYAGFAVGDVFDASKLQKKAQEKGYRTKGFSYEDLFTQIYAQEVESHLGANGHPTLIYDYPKEFAALAKLNEDGITAQRFEFYIGGIELGDCYSELTSASEQRARFEKEQKDRSLAGLISHPVDWGFVEALEYGLPECAGIAIGFDRLAMVFCDKTSIHDLRLVDIV